MMYYFPHKIKLWCKEEASHHNSHPYPCNKNEYELPHVTGHSGEKWGQRADEGEYEYEPGRKSGPCCAAQDLKCLSKF